MIALFIVLFVVLLVALILCIKLQFFAQYSDKLTLRFKVLFLNFTLVPIKKKEKKKPEKQEDKIPKKKKEKKKKKKGQSYLGKLTDKKGADGLFDMIVDLARLAGSTLKGVFANLNIRDFDVKVTVVGDDAADTALKYGKLCGAIYSAVAVICDNTKCQQYNVDVTPDFDDEDSMRVSAHLDCYIRVFYVLRYALRALIKLLLIRYKR